MAPVVHSAAKSPINVTRLFIALYEAIALCRRYRGGRIDLSSPNLEHDVRAEG
jgi:hypothetical protein